MLETSAHLLHKGDHPWIEHDTCVYYGGAHVESVAQLELRVSDGRITHFGDTASATMLTKIRYCAGDSVHMETDHYDILVEQCLVG